MFGVGDVHGGFPDLIPDKQRTVRISPPFCAEPSYAPLVRTSYNNSLPGRKQPASRWPAAAQSPIQLQEKELKADVRFILASTPLPEHSKVIIIAMAWNKAAGTGLL